jgi:hypothetical protein
MKRIKDFEVSRGVIYSGVRVRGAYDRPKPQKQRKQSNMSLVLATVKAGFNTVAKVAKQSGLTRDVVRSLVQELADAKRVKVSKRGRDMYISIRK